MDPPARDRAEALLLKAARAYGVQVRRDDVQRAISDAEHGPALVEWATTHLVSDTLLTADELTLYTALDKSGQVDRLAALHDLADVQAVTEDDVRVAIDELKRSTTIISQQTETLRQQQDDLSRLVKKHAENDAKRRDLNHAWQKRSDVERRQLANEVEELSQNLGFRLSDLEQQARDAEPSLEEAVGGIFRSDDKLLSSLQKLGWELEQPDPDETQTVEKLREICMRLIKITVETIRTKLDMAYLDSLTTAERSGRAKPAISDEVKVLQEEVESLYSEILPVAQMSVDQQHLEPAIKSATARGGQSLDRTAAALTYINDCLDYLLDRISRLHTRVEAHQSHQTALAALASTARAEMAVEVASAPKPAVPAVPASPVRKPSPIRIRANTTGSHGQRRSSGIQEELPLEILFQNIGLPLLSLDEDDSKKQVHTLARALADRSQKGSDVARGAQESFEMSAIAQLEDARRAVQLLRDSVLAESPFGDVKLVDPEIEGSIAVLEQEIDKAKQKLKVANEQNVVAKSETREDLVQRWGS
ncbi:hypothetical protein TOPH_08583 [Tolypocladium ophioglossoides CBS 100239]|uniref:HAUS augmin-like complex subunit 3 N-terminal domain-containing protein n=1 Tax=Tolypocladium ophioglossoides (strain CBS 100239) TaxID=1163406 RepID=A0A0L0MY41_TOLOC|nr:hypothetical protein TOPH_08583 [Tolypocladium ophioglossoides CBS 100239]